MVLYNSQCFYVHTVGHAPATAFASTTHLNHTQPCATGIISHSFGRYLLNARCVADTVLGAEGIAVNKVDKDLCPYVSHTLMVTIIVPI